MWQPLCDAYVHSSIGIHGQISGNCTPYLHIPAGMHAGWNGKHFVPVS